MFSWDSYVSKKDCPEDIKIKSIALFNASSYCCLDIVDSLIIDGANVNEKNSNNETPLYAACYWGHVDMVKLLLRYNAGICDKNNDGYTPMMIARQKNRNDVVKSLRNEMNKRIYIMSLVINHDVLKYHVIKKIDICLL